MAHLPGEFQSGALITAHDHEELVANLNTVYGLGTGASGYGSIASVAADLPAKAVTGLVENEDWRDDLKDAWEATAAHQGIILADPLPLDSNLEDGDLIGFGAGTSAPLFANFDSATNFADITTNKDVHTGESFTIFADPLAASVRTTLWKIQVNHEVSLTFNTQDDARAHFNTGGDIRISATFAPASGTPHNLAWQALLAILPQPVIFTRANYFALGTSYTDVHVREDTTAGPYDIGATGPITWRVQAKTNTTTDPGGRGGNGNIITINSIFLDQHVLHPGDPDEVLGTLASQISTSRSVGIFVKPIPTSLTISNLNTGGG